jgi:hypothetical protein
VNQTRNEKRRVPPAVISSPPQQELEAEVREHPDDADAKVDLGSDESMDASDPPSVSRPGSGDEPAPSSGFPDQKGR